MTVTSPFTLCNICLLVRGSCTQSCSIRSMADTQGSKCGSPIKSEASDWCWRYSGKAFLFVRQPRKNQ
uniref:Putative secreted protein n=1 Tax=Ixodes ricinus TaxID=34613 RepID=A0A6B0U0T6_IXORI